MNAQVSLPPPVNFIDTPKLMQALPSCRVSSSAALHAAFGLGRERRPDWLTREVELPRLTFSDVEVPETVEEQVVLATFGVILRESGDGEGQHRVLCLTYSSNEV